MSNKTNVDSFETKPKKDFITLTFFREKQQVAQVNFDTKELALKVAQALLAAHFGAARLLSQYNISEAEARKEVADLTQKMKPTSTSFEVKNRISTIISDIDHWVSLGIVDPNSDYGWTPGGIPSPEIGIPAGAGNQAGQPERGNPAGNGGLDVMSMNPKTILPPEVFAKFEQTIAELNAGKRACPRCGNQVISIHACFGCEFGHMAGCHYPKAHGYGVCGHKGRAE